MASAASNMLGTFSYIAKNGVEVARGTRINVAAAAGLSAFYGSVFSAIIAMNGTTDYIEIFVLIDSVGGLADGTLDGGGGSTFMTAQRISS